MEITLPKISSERWLDFNGVTLFTVTPFQIVAISLSKIGSGAGLKVQIKVQPAEEVLLSTYLSRFQIVAISLSKIGSERWAESPD